MVLFCFLLIYFVDFSHSYRHLLVFVVASGGDSIGSLWPRGFGQPWDVVDAHGEEGLDEDNGIGAHGRYSVGGGDDTLGGLRIKTYLSATIVSYLL